MGKDDRRVKGPRDGEPVDSDPAAATEKEGALHAQDCTPRTERGSNVPRRLFRRLPCGRPGQGVYRIQSTFTVPGFGVDELVAPGHVPPTARLRIGYIGLL
jgi:hypothetical protein